MKSKISKTRPKRKVKRGDGISDWIKYAKQLYDKWFRLHPLASPAQRRDFKAQISRNRNSGVQPGVLNIEREKAAQRREYGLPPGPPSWQKFPHIVNPPHVDGECSVGKLKIAEKLHNKRIPMDVINHVFKPFIENVPAFPSKPKN